MSYQNFTGKTISDALTNASVALGITSDHIDYEVIEKGSTGLFGIGSKDAVIRVKTGDDDEDQTAVNTPVVEETVEETVEVTEEPTAEDASTEKAEDAASDVNEESSEASSKSQKSAKKANRKPADPDTCVGIVTDFLRDMFEAMQMDVEIDCSYDEEDDSIDVELSGPEMGVIIGKRGQTLDSVQYLANLALNRKIDTYTRVRIDTEDYRARRKATLENLARNVAYRVKRTHKAASLEPMNPYERRIIHSALQNDRYVTTHSEGEEPYRHVVITLKPREDHRSEDKN